MALLILSFIAGVLTVAAPCILPLLPIIVGGSLLSKDSQQKDQWYRPIIVTASLAGSIILFTLLLKATTVLLGVPQVVWNAVSGGIVLLFGLNLLFPDVWEKIMIASKLSIKSNKLLGVTYAKKGISRDVLIGAALGPVFSSCSPTYALIVAAVLPQSFAQGLVYLLAYSLGLASVLLLVSFLGRSVVQKLGWLSNPSGFFRKFLGIIFVIVGLSVLFGLDRKFQAYVLDQGWYDPIMKLEQRLE